MKINWKLRLQSPQFWIGLIGVIGSPILTYMGMTTADLTSWQSIWDMVVTFVSNPYLIGTVGMSVLAFLGVVVDPTTTGLSDSARARTYTNRSNNK